MKKKDLQLFVYYKQGDDLSFLLEEYDDPREALKIWGTRLVEAGNNLIAAAKDLESCSDISVVADCHHVEILNIEENLANKLLKNPVFYEYDADSSSELVIEE